jgi:purine-binding chemotaxis protein CheW
MSQTADAIDLSDKFVTLGVEREIFAIDVDAVHEILDPRPMAVLPHAPAFLRGIIEVRGAAVPVIDLRRKLGFPPAEITEHSRIVVVEVHLPGRALILGLLADRVFEVTELDSRATEMPPDIGVRWRSEYIRGIGRRNGGFVIVFDLVNLFSQEEAALLIRDEIR